MSPAGIVMSEATGDAPRDRVRAWFVALAVREGMAFEEAVDRWGEFEGACAAAGWDLAKSELRDEGWRHVRDTS